MVQRWAFTPKEYGLLYPDVLVGDLGNGLHAVVNSWCNVWNIDLATGAYTHTTWDTQGTNHRQYGWNQLIDVDGDGKLDYVSLTSTKRVDVLLNRGGRLEHAWSHGWPDTVTTEARSLVRPGDPVSDLDADGKMEVCAAVFDGLTDKRWHLFIWDAVTGAQKAEAADLVPLASVPLWGQEGPRALLCARSAQIAYDRPESYEAWRLHHGRFEKVWTATNVTLLLEGILRNDLLIPNTTGTNVCRMVQANEDGRVKFFTVSIGGKKVQAWGSDAEGNIVQQTGRPPVPPPAAELPGSMSPLSGATVPFLLAADVDGDSLNEVLLYDNVTVSVARMQEKDLRILETFPSTEIPIVCDLLGDGTRCILTAGRGEDGSLWVQARGSHHQPLWRYAFPQSGACGQYSQRPHYFTVGRFTGRAGLDVFAYSTKPEARSYVLDGRTGQPVWERRDLPQIERSLQPFGGRGGVWDYNNDGAEDIFLCNPDYYCIVNGRTGDLLVGPASISEIAKWWAAYASPVILPRPHDAPIVYLGNAYSSRLSIRIDGSERLWREYLPTDRWALGGRDQLPEGILPPTKGRGWRIGQVESDGTFVCFDAATGQHQWTLGLATASSGIITGDIDGDGELEFLLGGTDGSLWAVRDAGDHGVILWRKKFEAPVGTPVLADVNGDSKSEIIVSVGDGFVYVLG